MTGETDKILVHPALGFERAVEGLQVYSIQEFVDLFVQAVENDYPRDGLLEFARNERVRKDLWLRKANEFVEWCRLIARYSEQNTDSPETAPVENTEGIFDGRQSATEEEQLEAAKRLLGSSDFDLERWIQAADDRAQAFLKWQESFREAPARKGIEAALAYIKWKDEEDAAFHEKLLDEAASSFKSVLDYDEKIKTVAASSPYWYFSPAWDFHTAFWQTWFGEDDPASTIAFHFRNAFKSETKQIEYKGKAPPTGDQPTIASALREKLRRQQLASWEQDGLESEPRRFRLRDEDLEITVWILDGFSRHLSKYPGYKQPQTDQTTLMRALITASGWGDRIGGGLVWKDDDFAAVIDCLPDWLLDHLRAYWDDLYWDQNIRESLEEEDKELLTSHVAFFVEEMIRYAEGGEKLPYSERPQRFFSDRDILSLLQQLSDEDFFDSSVHNLRASLLRAILKGRQTVFGGVMPFTAEESCSLIDLEGDDEASWLVRLDCFLPDRVGGSESPIWAFVPDEAKPKSNVDYRTDPRAVRRFQAFRATLANMQAECLDDLATAWWAFFIASQTIAFRGLGLPAPLIKQTAKVAASLLPCPSLEKSIRLAADFSSRHSHPLEAKAIEIHFSHLIPTPAAPRSELNVTDISISPEVAEKYLRKIVGGKAWDKMHGQSRRDLIEAEQIWARSAWELGYRQDWGALIALYARAVESEVRDVALPIVEAARKFCNRPVREPMLGECIYAGTDMAQLLEQGPDINIRGGLRLRIERFNEIMKKSGKQMVGIRNRADHANREKPVDSVEFARWRRAMFEERIFTKLAELNSPSFM